jgi:hypothetical protein
MAGTVQTFLKVLISANTKGFKKDMTDGEKALHEFDKKLLKAGESLIKMLSPMALIAGAGGLMAIFQKSIESVEGPGDRFNAVVKGAGESLFELQRALGSLDFTNFFKNLTEGFARGKEFEEAIDQLADKTAYSDYKIADLNRGSESLQEIVKNKTLELSVRTEAARKVLEIESQIKKRKIELAQVEFNIMKAQWEGRNKMVAEEAAKLYETIDNLSEETKKKLDDSFGRQISLFGKKEGVNRILSGEAEGGMLKGIPKEVIESYAAFFRLVEQGEKDVLIKLFNTFKNIDEAEHQAQKEYNGIISQTTKLLAQEEKQLQKNKSAVENLNNARDNGPGKVTTDNITMPSFGQTSFSGIVGPAQAASNSLKTVMLDIQAINNTIEAAIEASLVGFGEWLGNLATGAAGISGLAVAILAPLGDMLIQLGKIAIAAGVGLEAIKDSFASMNPVLAIAAGVALVALGTIIKGAVSKIGSGGAAGGAASGNAGGQSFGNASSLGFVAQQKEMVITLTGQLVAKGSDLIFVLEKEYGRRRVTT